MLGIHDLWLFVVSAVLVNISPGPDSAYIVGRSLQLGWRAGMMAALGISCGCLVHVFGTAIGLSALLMASSVAFTVIKWVGAAYLCYIGITMLLSRRNSEADVAAAASGAVAPRPCLSLRQVFWQGVLTDVLNPKVALFFLAFLPQFVNADEPHKSAAFILLGLMFISTGTVWCFTIAALAARAAFRLRQSSRALVWINRALGGVFVYLGVRIAALQAR
ncbi:MAG TPA: LysE family translocator [Bradyrhizobium sp.]|jgi:threonine/homoserine/homoserine lactone efflux protein